MRRGQVVSGIASVFTAAAVERIKQRAVRDAETRIQQRRDQHGARPLPQVDVQLPVAPAAQQSSAGQQTRLRNDTQRGQ